MTDVEKLLLETIKPSLESLENKGIGFIDLEDRNGIRYKFDDKTYLISVKEDKE